MSPVYRRQYKDISVQTDFCSDSFNINQSIVNTVSQPQSRSITHEQGTQPQTLSLNDITNPNNYTKTTISSKSTKSTKSKSTNSRHYTKSKQKHNKKSASSHTPESIIKSYTISPLNDVPPENLLHCTFQLQNNPITLLIDTGAGISIIKQNKIGISILNKSDIVSIVGISNTQSSICSYGSTEISLDSFPKFKFHVANLNIKADGILGNDFMSKFNVKLYIKSKTMHIQDKIYKLHYLNELKINNESDKQLIVNRSETVIRCRTNTINSGTAIVDKQLLDNDIVIPHALVNVVNNLFSITCINTSKTDKKITTPTIVVEPIDINNYISTNNNNSVTISNLNLTDRQTKVLNSIRREHLNSEESESLDKIISEFSDIFFTESDSLTFSNHTKHRIPTTTDTPIHTKTYRFPQIHESEVKTQVKEMLNQGIIQPSTSPWSSPIWVVPKKLDASGKQKWRLVIDYRKLNEVTVGDSYPLPNITDILDKLGHSQYFTTLDLASGFHQLEVQPQDIPKTAFNTPYGHYEFKRMPFGLKNAPATFQRVMDSVLSGLQGERCFVYLDDIVIFASSLQEHEVKLREVFSRLRKYELKVQPDKCEFLRREVAYLGHIISSEGVKPNPDKIQAVNDFPIPKCCKDIKAFLGLTGYYRRFISNFSKITKPLTSLLKKDTPFIWGDSQQKSFEECKQLLTSPPILQYPDFTKEFILTTDASIHAIGAVLSQGPIGKDLPIAYASRTLNKAESNYSTIERELLAIVWAVKHFRPYLFGRRFKIVTDHKPLTWLFSVKDPGSRLVRWRLKLEEFEYEIIYKCGKNNTNADALSRPAVMNTNSINPTLNNDTSTSTTQTQAHSEDYLQINYSHFTENPTYSFDTSNLNISPDSLLNDKHKNIFIPISCELSDKNDLFNQSISMCSQVDSYLEKPKELYDVDLLVSDKKQNLMFSCTRPKHFDPWDSESYFKALLNCLQSNNFKTLHVPDLKNDSTCKLQGNEQLHITAYLADSYECKITICENKVTCPKPEDIPEILKTFHDDPLSGHRGIIETTRKIRANYYWKGMTDTIESYINNCKICQRNKIQRKTYKAPMVLTSSFSEPFERVTIDLVSYSDITGDCNKYILTLQDDLTRFVQAYPIPDKQATTIAKSLLIFCQHYGVPKRFHSDQGGEFVNNILKQLMKLIGSNHTLSTAYHPQTNGALERFHAVLRDHIRMYSTKNAHNWDRIIPLAIMCHNTSVNQSTGFTPHELLFGYKPRLLYSLKETHEYTTNDYLNDLIERMKISRDIARRNVEDMKERAKTRYDNNIKNLADFHVGDNVMLRVPNPNNLDSKWDGPYEIIRKGFNENYVIRKSGRNQLVHGNRLRPVHNSPDFKS